METKHKVVDKEPVVKEPVVKDPKPTIELGTQLTSQPDGKPTPSQEHEGSEIKHPDSVPGQLTKEGQIAVPPGKEKKVDFPVSTGKHKVVGQKANALNKLDELDLAIKGYSKKEGYDIGPSKATLERLKKDLKSDDKDVVNDAIEEACGLVIDEGAFKKVREVASVKK